MSIKDGQQLPLFDAGPRRDPWRHDPATWAQDAGEHDVVAWHSTDKQTLPKRDDPHRQVDFSGSTTGMHLGTYKAAAERAERSDLNDRPWIHPARISKATIQGAVMSDEDANESQLAEEHVQNGDGVAYTNLSEDPGSVSYRVHPNSVRTWADDVTRDSAAHPALKHLADRGYNLTVHTPSEGARQHDDLANVQGTLWDYETTKSAPGKPGGADVIGYHQHWQSAGQQAKELTGSPYGNASISVQAAGYTDRQYRYDQAEEQSSSRVGAWNKEQFQPKLRKVGKRI